MQGHTLVFTLVLTLSEFLYVILCLNLKTMQSEGITYL